MDWAFSGYINAVGLFFWPIVFTVIIVYVYLKNQSFVTLAVAALIIFAAFGNALAGVGIWANILYISVSIIIAGLILLLFIRRRI